jgi:hypothetical protein
LLFTPNAKFNAYINYDYGQNRDAIAAQGNTNLIHWQGIAGAFHEQATGKQALAGRFEYFNDPNVNDNGPTGLDQHLFEFTATYEYKWVEGLLTRIEYRGDFSNKNYFTKDATLLSQQSQSTLTVAFIAFFGPKR